MTYKLGKKPARKGAVKLKLANYQKKSALPTPPVVFGHQNLIEDWNMYANDKYGDCVFAGAGHETLLWNKEAGRDLTFTDSNILSGYTAVTGFNATDPSTDNGTDMEEAAKWRRKVGLRDSNGKRHRIGAYLALKPGDVQQLKLAVYLYSAVGIGIKFPASAMDQFNNNEPWRVVEGSEIEGGHYVPVVGYDDKFIYVVTWGKVHPVTPDFIEKYMDEGVAYLSREFLNETGKSLEGFDLDTLSKDLNSL